MIDIGVGKVRMKKVWPDPRVLVRSMTTSIDCTVDSSLDLLESHHWLSQECDVIETNDSQPTETVAVHAIRIGGGTTENVTKCAGIQTMAGLK